MVSFLITGARAPVALELARNFYSHGHRVILADSLTYPLARNLRTCLLTQSRCGHLF